jgi:phage gpG-like protein
MNDVVEFKISPPLVAIEQYLKPIARQMRDLRLPLKKSSIYLDRWVQQNFRAQGQKLSTGRWPPFKLGGRRLKRKIRGKNFDPATFSKVDRGARLLQDTGRLRNSFRPFFSNTDAGIGSKLKYAPFHEFGVPKRKLPARRMLPRKAEVQKGVKDIFVNHVRDALARGKYPFANGGGA